MQHTTYCRRCAREAMADCRAYHTTHLQEQYTAASRLPARFTPTRPQPLALGASSSREQDSLQSSSSTAIPSPTQPPPEFEEPDFGSPTDSLYISFPLDPPQQSLSQRLISALGFRAQDGNAHIAADALQSMRDDLGAEIASDRLIISGTQQEVVNVREAESMVSVALTRRGRELAQAQRNPRSGGFGPSLISEISSLRMEIRRLEDRIAALEEKVKDLSRHLADKERLHRYLQKRYARTRADA